MTDSQPPDQEALEFLERLLSPGSVVSLRKQLNLRAGTYAVVSRTDDMIKIRPKKGDAVKISIHQFIRALDVDQSRELGPPEGVLHACGYSVGMGGRPTMQRRVVLERVFRLPFNRLPAVENRDEWGAAESPQRLGKMFSCLTAFAENARRRKNPPLDAISDWESDRAWLRERFSESSS